MKLPLGERKAAHISAIVATSLATTARGHVNHHDIDPRSRASRIIALQNMADKSNARPAEQHATTDTLKLVNRLNESRSPYVGVHSLCFIIPSENMH